MHSTFNTQKLLMQPKKYPEQEATSEHITLTKWGDTTYKTVTINGRNNTEFLWKLFFPHNYIKFSINHIPLLHSSLSPSKAYRYIERKLYEQIKNSSVILKKSTVLFWQTKYTLAWPGLLSKYKEKKALKKNLSLYTVQKWFQILTVTKFIVTRSRLACNNVGQLTSFKCYYVNLQAIEWIILNPIYKGRH